MKQQVEQLSETTGEESILLKASVSDGSLSHLGSESGMIIFVFIHQVEQLSETTGDESILLTASVSDGATSHLGTRCGNTFLDGQEEFKSQFLNYVQKCKYRNVPKFSDARKLWYILPKN